jgi:phospholipase/lecithinase/hemolysin
MKLKSGRGWMLMGVLALALLAPDWAGAQPSLRRIVVFGTSLSDPGNAFALAGGTNTPPDYDLVPFLVPNTPYARGGHHFSNGATWVEQFARSAGLAASAKPAFRGSNRGATNYAVGGTRARDVTGSFTLSMQVGAFLQQFGGAAPSDALYVIEMGGNDIRDALEAAPRGGDFGAILSEAALSIGASIEALHGAGARNFLVWNAPNLGATPALRAAGAEEVGNAFSLLFNSLLDGQIADLEKPAPDGLGISIPRFDVYSSIAEIVAHPTDFGLTDVTSACITPQTAPFHCQNSDEHLFWDGIHPTKAAHGIIAQQVAAALR